MLRGYSAKVFGLLRCGLTNRIEATEWSRAGAHAGSMPFSLLRPSHSED